MLKRCLTFFGTLLALAGAFALQAEETNVINVKSSSDLPISMAVIPFKIEARLSEPLMDYIYENFRISGRLEPIPFKELDNLPYQTQDILFDEWKKTKAEYLILGTVNQTEAGLKVRSELYDLFEKKVVYLYDKTFPADQVPEIANDLSNTFFEAITGIQGVFHTKLAYVSEKRTSKGSVFELFVNYLNGSRSAKLLGSRDSIMSLDWSNDSSQLAYVSFEQGIASVYIQKLEQGKRERLNLFNSSTSAPNFDQNGLFFVVARNSSSDIYRLDFSDRKVKRITSDKDINTEPSSFKDGEKILFTSDRYGNPAVFELDMKSKKTLRLTKDSTYSGYAKYLDKHNILFIRQGDDRVFSLFHLDMRSGYMKQLTFSENVESFDISPDGEYVIYTQLNSLTRQTRLKILNLRNNKSFLLFNRAYKSKYRVLLREPAWSEGS